ncbi:MAG: RNA polymerase sigma factor [Clostridiales bacterium]|nr:RNA polymerase sigma factor [Clostridiales bacterium]
MLPDNKYLADLMKQAARGNEAAFSDIVRHFERIVYNIAIQATGNREDALDVSQEVFMKLWRTAGSYRGECSVTSWVIRIARNTSLDALRRRSTRQTDSLTLEDEDGDTTERAIPVTEGDDDPVSSYERKERIAAVRRAISELCDEHKEIILLRNIQGLSYAEIADLLGIEEGTVKSRIHRARNCLKEKLISWNIL